MKATVTEHYRVAEMPGEDILALEVTVDGVEYHTLTTAPPKKFDAAVAELIVTCFNRDDYRIDAIRQAVDDYWDWQDDNTNASL